MNFTCTECNDTGSRDKSGDYLDCGHCDAAMQRKAMNDFLDKLPAMGDYDAAWLVHQRALAMAPKQEAPTQQPVAWLVYAEDHNGMAPQHPAYATHLHATRCASMFGQTPTEVRPLYDHATPAAANGAMTDERAAFEAWSESKWKYDLHPAREGTADTYMEGETETAWMAWQARAALSGAKGN